MREYECIVCGYVYDPARGDETQQVPAGTPFDVPPADNSASSTDNSASDSLRCTSK